MTSTRSIAPNQPRRAVYRLGEDTAALQVGRVGRNRRVRSRNEWPVGRDIARAREKLLEVADILKLHRKWP